MTPGPLDMIEAVRAHHRAYEQSDWNAALAVLAGDLEYEMVDSGPLSGTYRGREGVAAAMGDWIRAWERDSIHFRAEQLVVTQSTVVAHCVQTARGRASGLEVELRLTQVWEFGDDGLATRMKSGVFPDPPLPANVAAILDAEAGRATGDVPRALAVLADDVVFHADGRGTLAGPWHGPDGVRRFFAEWLSVWEGHEGRLELVVDLGDRVVTRAVQRARSRAAGVEVEMVNHGSWWFRDGKVVLVRFFESLEAALGHTEPPLP